MSLKTEKQIPIKEKFKIISISAIAILFLPLLISFIGNKIFSINSTVLFIVSLIIEFIIAFILGFHKPAHINENKEEPATFAECENYFCEDYKSEKCNICEKKVKI